MKKLWFVAFSVILMMTGCVNDEEVAPAGEKDVNSIIRDYAEQLNTDIANIQGSSAMVAMESFALLPDNAFQAPFSLKINDLSFYYANLRKVEGSVEPESFDFSANVGVYNWNSYLQQFIRSDDVVDYIQLDFPATYGGLENNATLRIMKYAEVDLTGIIDPSLGLIIEITSLESELIIDGITEMSVHYDAGYDDSGNLRNVIMETVINPFELSVDLAQSNGVMQINSIWRKQGAPILSSYFLIAKNNINFTPYDGFAFTGKTSGYIKYRELKLDGSFDFSKIEIENPDKEAAVQMSLYQGSRKLGKLYIDFQTEGEQVIPGSMHYFIEIEDKSRISADHLIEPLFEGFNSLK